MPTIDDAIAVLTDPEFRAMGGREGDLVAMRGGAVLAHLQQLGASETDARGLVRQALAELGGVDRSHYLQSKGIGAGRPPRQQWVDLYLVPESAIRKPDSAD